MDVFEDLFLSFLGGTLPRRGGFYGGSLMISRTLLGLCGCVANTVEGRKTFLR